MRNDTNIVDVSTENIDYINIMKTKSTLIAVASISALLTGCVYDEGSGYYNNYQTSPGVYPQVQQQYNQPRVYRTTTTITTRRNQHGSHCNNGQNNGYYQQNNGYNNGYNDQNNGYNGQNNGFFGALFGQNNGYNSGNNGYNAYQGPYQGSGKAGSYSNNSGLGGYNNGYRPY